MGDNGPRRIQRTDNRHAEDGLIEGLRKGLEGARPGDQLVVLFNSKFGFGRKAVGTVPANSALAYQLWITGVDNR